MKVIRTRKGLEILVDDEDYESLSAYVWGTNDQGYAVRTCRKTGERHDVRMHRQIIGLQRSDKVSVDHIDGNKLNNQKANLRICNNAENSWNKGALSTNTTGFKGVTLRPGGRYFAYIQRLGRRIGIGPFDTPEADHEAYCKAALEMHGAFANFGDASTKEKQS